VGCERKKGGPKIWRTSRPPHTPRFIKWRKKSSD
jgi:hypothetical protein